MNWKRILGGCITFAPGIVVVGILLEWNLRDMLIFGGVALGLSAGIITWLYGVHLFFGWDD